MKVFKDNKESKDTDTFGRVIFDNQQEDIGIAPSIHQRTLTGYQLNTKPNLEPIQELEGPSEALDDPNDDILNQILVEDKSDQEKLATHRELSKQSEDSSDSETNNKPEFRRYQFYEGNSKLW